MISEEWIPFATATLIIASENAAESLRNALILGQVRSCGYWWGDLDELSRYGHAEPAEVEALRRDIPAERWASWAFIPRRQWLVPPEHAKRKVCGGFDGVRLLRADVEKIASAHVASARASKGNRARVPSLAEGLAIELKQMYPQRPVKQRGAIEAELRKRPNVGHFGQRTFEKAMSMAWQRPGGRPA